MFTGLQPKAHGAVRHSTEDAALFLGVPLLPETFQHNGYITRGISSNSQVTSAFGFGRGFDVYECPVWETQVTPKGIESLQSLDEPFFLFLHYMGPHQPYAPPAPWLGLYHGQAGVSSEEDLSDAGKAERQQKEEAYFEEITAEDRRVGRLAHGLVIRATIDIAGAILIVRVPQEGGRHMDGRHHAAALLIDMAHGLSGQRAGSPVVLFSRHDSFLFRCLHTVVFPSLRSPPRKATCRRSPSRPSSPSAHEVQR